jgi:hypothetical protein
MSFVTSAIGVKGSLDIIKLRVLVACGFLYSVTLFVPSGNQLLTEPDSVSQLGYVASKTLRLVFTNGSVPVDNFALLITNIFSSRAYVAMPDETDIFANAELWSINRLARTYLR